jgi:beta-mannosidase
MHVTALTDWTLGVDPEGPTPPPDQSSSLLGRVLPARVPGAVHGDLLDAGLIPDPFVDAQEFDVAWVSRTDWVYRTPIERPEGFDRVDLVFDGVDTVASVRIDGVEVGRSFNMHRRCSYPVPAGATEVAVHLTAPYTFAEAEQWRYGKRPNAYPEPFNYLRKMACSFGWDWGPTVAGAGIWRPVRLEAWNVARLVGVRPLVDVVDGVGVLRVLVDAARSDRGRSVDLDIDVVLDGEPVGTTTVPPGQDSGEITIRVPNVRVWQPVGYGRPELYDLEVRLSAGDLLDSCARRIGFRRLELDRSVDRTGSTFMFVVNGNRILAKGVNWIPDDVLPGRMTRARYQRRLTEAASANVNLIRVWGGGIYESDDFYDVADELGLLVWQDFLFACACYPEDEPLRSEVLAEAADNVARLSAHPSLVLWNGNNENLWLYEAEGWNARENGELPWGTRYYLEDLPRVVAEVDPSRPYNAGSPWSGSWDFPPNDTGHQTFHSWDVWNREDYTHYRDTAPRFVAEFGWQAPPAWTTLRDAVTDDPITPSSPGVLHHQKAMDGNGKLERGLAHHFPVPGPTSGATVNAWHYLTQLNQVRAIETGIRHWRSHWPHTAGTVMWQLNDLWPVTSWAAIDGAGRHKPLYHALRELYAKRGLTLEPTDGGLVLGVLNDSAEPWAGVVRLRRLGDDGLLLAEGDVTVDVAARSAARVPVNDAVLGWGDPTRELLVADLGPHRALHFPVEPRESRFVHTDPTVVVTSTGTGLTIAVTATTVLRDVLVQPDRIHPAATADRGFVTLLPGETGVVEVRCAEPLTGELTDPYALTWLDRVLTDVRGAATE